MRTTVVLPPELLRAAKIRASQQGESLKELITRAVDREVAERPKSSSRKLVLPLIGHAGDRVRWAGKTSQVEATFRAISAQRDHNHKLWTDDYLAAFAQAWEASLATLDRHLQERYPSIHVDQFI